jgi:hypothetical protein
LYHKRPRKSNSTFYSLPQYHSANHAMPASSQERPEQNQQPNNTREEKKRLAARIS